jgi:two-component system alkaline phosphatase synthesis response regulator PhoP
MVTMGNESAQNGKGSADAGVASGDILIVDDHEQNIELLEAYLDELGGSVRSARDGLEALRLIEARKPRLILLDVMMPKMSGFQLCRKLKADAATRDIRVIMITALGEESDRARATDCGADDFLTKPVAKPDLLDRVRLMLARG